MILNYWGICMDINVNDVISTIFKRRSIRKYIDKEVENLKITLLLKSAMAAPTAANRQPWEFIVVTDKEKLNELRSALREGQYNAPVAIVVCGNMDLAFSNKSKEIWTQDCSAAIENMLIAAVSLELGSVWIGLYPELNKCKPVCKALNIPDHVIPMSVVYFGYPDELKEPRTQYNDKRIYWQEYESERKHKARPKNIKKLGPL
jgi:nitroreductase